jgi:hypothetical protein
LEFTDVDAKSSRRQHNDYGGGRRRTAKVFLPARIILKYESWSEYSRVTIINFIENYKTAYALKRLDYIESIFSDNALIIVG